MPFTVIPAGFSVRSSCDTLTAADESVLPQGVSVLGVPDP
jgi:hypothetical protein